MPSKPGELARLVAARGVRDERVLAAVRAVPREAFAPPAERERAYEDEPLPIGHGQVTSQPSLIATMVEALALSGEERVLEVGTGLGWQTALLGRLAREVWSVEYLAELADAAQKNLLGAGVENAHVIVADGSEGLPEHAPFDAIVVAAAHPSVPPPLGEQLTLGGASFNHSAPAAEKRSSSSSARRTGSRASGRSSAPASCVCTGATGSGSDGA